MYLSISSSLSLLFVIALFSTRTSASPVAAQPDYPNRIIFIRHGEKGFSPDQVQSKRDGFWPPWFPGHGGPGRGPPNGLSEKGKQRAQYLRKLFGNESDYNFGLIFAAPRTPEEKETERTYATVAPLAADLSLQVNIDCANSPASCVAEQVADFAATSDADILISWKHRDLNIIATALGAPNAKKTYPDERNDIIWIMQGGRIVEKRSQHCPGLDDARVDKGDPDLEVEKASQGFWSWLFCLWNIWRIT